MMQPFYYHYRGEIKDSSAVLYSDNGHLRYLVSLGELWVTIAPSGFTDTYGKIIWVQSNKPGEIVQPHELVQAMGEGIEMIE